MMAYMASDFITASIAGLGKRNFYLTIDYILISYINLYKKCWKFVGQLYNSINDYSHKFTITYAFLT